MRYLRLISGSLLSVLLIIPSWGQLKTELVPSGNEATRPLLPTDFSGWQKTAVPGTAIPSTTTKILLEYGFQGAESGSYQRGDRKILIRAMRFADATGAYGAFTFYRTPEMAKEKFGDDGASDGNHVIFYCSNVLVDVMLDKLTAMTPAEMRDLATSIPRVGGNLAELPKLPLHLSEEAQKNVRYIAGPASLDQMKGTVTSSLIDFSLSPEVVVGTEQTLDGSATVVLAQYPTPKIAQAQVQKLNDWAAAQSADWAKTQTIAPAAKGSEAMANRFATRRSGPIVAIVTGQISENDARKILTDVNYDAEVTWSEPAYNPKNNIGNLVVNMVYLSFIVVGLMFMFGLVFGGFRIFMKRFFPGRVIDRPEDVEFIKLNLR
jgi:hypothetical protein